MKIDANQSFGEIILRELQRDHAEHEEHALCASEPHKLLVQVPACSGTDAKSLASYFKRKREFLTTTAVEAAGSIDVAKIACCFVAKSELKLASPAKAASPSAALLQGRMLQDYFRAEQEEELKTACERIPHLRDAFRLINFWMERNQPVQTLGAFPALALHLALAHVCTQEAKMWSKASVLQLFKRALKWLADSHLDDAAQVTRIGGNNKNAKYNLSDQDFTTAFPICLIWQNALNTTFAVLPSSYRLLKAQAIKALASQEDEESLLMHRGVGSPFERFDLLLRLAIPPPPLPASSNAAAEANNKETWQDLFVRKAEALADEALVQTGRVHEFGFFLSNKVVILGLFLNPEQTFRLLDKGPASEDLEQAQRFRDFWGELAELRRFKDGSVLESVVWGDEHNRRLIPQRIMEHLLKRHVSPSSSATLIGNALEADNGMRDDANILHAIERFATLEQRIRAVPGLPLQINHVSLVDAPSLRYTRSVPPKLLLSKQSRCVKIVGQILLRFETSSRFPKEEEARKKVETVLLIELAKGLEKRDAAAEEEENGGALTCIVTSERYMDVITADGFVFRIRLMRSGNEREEDVLLHSKLHNLHHSTLFGASRSFGAVCRLVKRWVSGQRFSSVLSDNLVDVLVASMFTQADPPRSGLCGLFRFFNLLTAHDWANRPLLVNLEEPYAIDFAMRNRADANLFKLRGTTRRNGPPAVVYVFTSKKDDPAVFHDATLVEPLAWKRVVERAAASKLFLERLCTMEEDADERYWTALFASDAQSEGFDAVLTLDLTCGGLLSFDGSSSSAAGGRKKARYQNLVPLQLESEALIGFDPLELLLQELRNKFGQYAVFFAGEEGDAIGVLLKTKTLPFTIANTKFAQPLDDKTLEINERELVHAMFQAGNGLIIADDL